MSAYHEVFDGQTIPRIALSLQRNAAAWRDPPDAAAGAQLLKLGIHFYLNHFSQAFILWRRCDAAFLSAKMPPKTSLVVVFHKAGE